MKRRILTIDGGGTKGAYAAAFLEQLESTLVQPIGNYFDLIVATSTGGIIAAGLGLDIPISKIRELYENHSKDIFKKKIIKLPEALYYLTGWAQYDRVELEKVLKKYIGDARIGESSIRLVIPAFNANSKELHIYKTSHHSSLKMDYKELMTDAVLSTTAAPLKLDPHITQYGAMIDGGIFAVDPISIAVTEALSFLDWDLNETHILSIGSVINRNTGLLNVALTAQQKLAQGNAKLIMGHKNIYRIEEAHTATGGDIAMDDPKSIPELICQGRERARYKIRELDLVFFDGTAEIFTPCHKL